MTRLIVYTQVFENYAYAYEDDQSDHRKAKGGCEYSLIIPGADMSNLSIEQIESAFQAATKEIEKDDRFYCEYVVGRPEVLENGQLTEFEQEQMDYDGEILYHPEEIVVSI